MSRTATVSDPASLSTHTLAPDSSAPAPVATSPKARGKAKAAKPAKAPRKPRLVPARTLRVRVAEIGPHHLEAFDLLVKRTPPEVIDGESYTFAELVREALDATDDLDVAEDEVARIEEQLRVAKKVLGEREEGIAYAGATLARLDTAARKYADLLGDVATAPHDGDVPEAAPTE